MSFYNLKLNLLYYDMFKKARKMFQFFYQFDEFFPLIGKSKKVYFLDFKGKEEDIHGESVWVYPYIV